MLNMHDVRSTGRIPIYSCCTRISHGSLRGMTMVGKLENGRTLRVMRADHL